MGKVAKTQRKRGAMVTHLFILTTVHINIVTKQKACVLNPEEGHKAVKEETRKKSV